MANGGLPTQPTGVDFIPRKEILPTGATGSEILSTLTLPTPHEKLFEVAPPSPFSPYKGFLENLGDIGKDPEFYLREGKTGLASQMWDHMLQSLSAGWVGSENVSQEDFGLLGDVLNSLTSVTGLGLAIAGPSKLLQAFNVPRHLAPFVTGYVYGTGQNTGLPFGTEEDIAKRLLAGPETALIFAAIPAVEGGIADLFASGAIGRGAARLAVEAPRRVTAGAAAVPFGALGGGTALLEGAPAEEVVSRTIGGGLAGALLGVSRGRLPEVSGQVSEPIIRRRPASFIEPPAPSARFTGEPAIPGAPSEPLDVVEPGTGGARLVEPTIDVPVRPQEPVGRIPGQARPEPVPELPPEPVVAPELAPPELAEVPRETLLEGLAGETTATLKEQFTRADLEGMLETAGLKTKAPNKSVLAGRLIGWFESQTKVDAEPRIGVLPGREVEVPEIPEVRPPEGATEARIRAAEEVAGRPREDFESSIRDLDRQIEEVQARLAQGEVETTRSDTILELLRTSKMRLPPVKERGGEYDGWQNVRESSLGRAMQSKFRKDPEVSKVDQWVNEHLDVLEPMGITDTNTFWEALESDALNWVPKSKRTETSPEIEQELIEMQEGVLDQFERDHPADFEEWIGMDFDPPEIPAGRIPGVLREPSSLEAAQLAAEEAARGVSVPLNIPRGRLPGEKVPPGILKSPEQEGAELTLRETEGLTPETRESLSQSTSEAVEGLLDGVVEANAGKVKAANDSFDDISDTIDVNNWNQVQYFRNQFRGVRIVLENAKDYLGVPLQRTVYEPFNQALKSVAKAGVGIFKFATDEVFRPAGALKTGRVAKQTRRMITWIMWGVPEAELTAEFGRAPTAIETTAARKMRTLMGEEAGEGLHGFLGVEGFVKEYFPRARDLILEIKQIERIVKGRGEEALTPEQKEKYDNLRDHGSIYTMFEGDIPKDIKWAHEMERTGKLDLLEEDSVKLFERYLRGGLRKKYLQPVWEKVKDRHGWRDEGLLEGGFRKGTFEKLGDYEGRYVAGYVRHVLGFTSPLENALNQLLTRGIEHLNKLVPANQRIQPGRVTVQKISRRLTDMVYLGGLGFRMGSALKNLTQSTLTSGEIGIVWTQRGMKQALTKEGRQIVKDAELFTGFAPSLERQMNLSKGALQKVTDAGLSLFSAADRANRTIAYLGARAKVLKLGTEGRFRTDNIRPETKRKVDQALAEGDIAKAADIYGKYVVAETQYLYTKANTPLAFRNALGRLMGQFMTWPLYFSELGVKWMGNAYRGKSLNDFAPLFNFILAAGALSYGAKAGGYDIANWFAFGAIPTDIGGPAFKATDEFTKLALAKAKKAQATVLGSERWLDHINREISKRERDLQSDLRVFIPGMAAKREIERLFKGQLPFPQAKQPPSRATQRERATQARRQPLLERRRRPRR